jgi:hypothetical protein
MFWMDFWCWMVWFWEIPVGEVRPAGAQLGDLPPFPQAEKKSSSRSSFYGGLTGFLPK